MIYINGIHLVADSVEELHKFAYKISLSKSWYHPGDKRYDIVCPHVMDKAISHGAKPFWMREILKIINN